MTYSDVASGIGSQAGETVSVSVVLDNTVRVWPAPVPALITTGRPAHWLAVHALVLSASAVLDAVMMYLDVPSGVVIHAGDTVSVFVVLEDTVRVWPAPVPAVIVTRRPAHRLIGHALVASWCGSGERRVGSAQQFGRPLFGAVVERGAGLRDEVLGGAVRARGPRGRDSERVLGVGGHGARLAHAGSGRDRDGASRPYVDMPRFGRVLERGARLQDDVLGRAVRRRGPSRRDCERVLGVGRHGARLARARSSRDAVGASRP